MFTLFEVLYCTIYSIVRVSRSCQVIESHANNLDYIY
jgi:hypothetical protein